MTLRCFASLLLVLCAARPIASHAQTFTVLHSFDYPLCSATSPANLSYSLVFTINPTRTLTMLHIFDSTNGAIN